MVVSASRRTDIPSFYSDWFFKRLIEGYTVTRNPMNHSQVKKISLLPSDVDCFAFWTKNPSPMLPSLSKLTGYNYYFQFSVTAYNSDIEINLPRKAKIIETFKQLSNTIGAERIIWRYDPVFLNNKYTLTYHICRFDEIAKQLSGYTNTVIISFIDLYAKFSKRFKAIEMTDDEKIFISQKFSVIAKENNMALKTCAEKIDLSEFGINHASCIDGQLIEKLTGKTLDLKRDKNQRPACGCVSSVDIGVYNTCLNGCMYCYANYNIDSITANVKRHNPFSAEILD